MDRLIVVKFLDAFSASGPTTFVLPVLILLAVLFAASLVWAVRDALSRGIPPVYAVLVLLLTGWPLSILLWIALRTRANSFLRKLCDTPPWQSHMLAAIFALGTTAFWSNAWYEERLVFVVIDQNELISALEHGDAGPVLRDFRLLAEAGSTMAQNNLGAIYALGLGVAQDDSEAVRWFRAAAEQGDTEAQKNLGLMYHQGQGVEQDYTEAAKWWRRAAEQGNPTAQYNLGVLYVKGQGVKPDFAEAQSWLRKSAAGGDEDAKKLLQELDKDDAAEDDG